MKQPYKYGTDDYWKNANEYTFDTTENGKPAGKLNVYAYSERAAKLKATNWEKWVKRKGFKGDKVLKNTIRRMVYG